MGKSNSFQIYNPKDRMDFTIRYVDFLQGDQITGSSWSRASTNPAGGVIDETSFTTGTATVWVISGTAGETYRYKNLVGTLLGRRIEPDIFVTIGDV